MTFNLSAARGPQHTSATSLQPVERPKPDATAILAALKSATPLLDAMCARALDSGNLQRIQDANDIRHRVTAGLCNGTMTAQDVRAELPHGDAQESMNTLSGPPLRHDESPAFLPMTPETKEPRRFDAVTGPGLHQIGHPPQLEMPEEPSLSDSANLLILSMTKTLASQTKLDRRCVVLITSTLDLADQDERSVVLTAMHEKLSEHSVTPTQAGAKLAALHRLESARHACSNQAQQVLTSTGEVLHRAAQASSADGAGMFGKKALGLVTGTLMKIRNHEPPGERYAMLAQFAQTLDDLTGNENLPQATRTYLSQLLATQVMDATTAMENAALVPHHSDLQTGHARLLAPHMHHRIAHTEGTLGRRISDMAIGGQAHLDRHCLDILRDIGTAMLDNKVKKSLLAHLSGSLDAMDAQARKDGVRLNLAGIYESIALEVGNTSRWPDAAVTAPLAHIVSWHSVNAIVADTL